MKKKLTAILLCAMMLVGSVPTGVVYADEEELNEQVEVVEVAEQVEEPAPEIPDETGESLDETAESADETEESADETEEQVPEEDEEQASGQSEIELEVTDTVSEEDEGITAELEEIPAEQEEPLEETPAPVDFDVVSAYEYAMTLGEEEIEAYVASLTPEQYDALAVYAMEAAGDSLDSGEIEYGETVCGEIAFADESVNVTDAAPIVKEQPKKMLMKAPAKAPANEEPHDPIKADGVETEKTVTPNEDGTYTITMEAYTTGEVSTQTSAVPTDIVLVLDQSGSMDETYKSITTAGYNIVNFDRDIFKVWHPNNAELNLRSNLFVKLDDGTYSRLEIYWFFENYYYVWTDENGNQKSLESFSSFGECPEQLRGKIYRMRTENTDMSRLEALQDAAGSFISNVQKDAAENNADHRIAVVGFASDGTNYSEDRWENTELLSTEKVVGHENIKASNYVDALVSANENGSVNTRLTNAINRLDAKGGTYINYGLEMAQGVFTNATNAEGRNRVVVILTDGVPGSGQWGSSVEGNSCASDALSKATALKNAGVTVYTIGIFDGADATSAGSNTGRTTEKSNYFMQKLSSNNGSVSNPSYYMSADNPEALNNIFQSISEQISTPTISLDASTTVTDIVTEYFNAPKEADIKIYTADKNADGTFDTPQLDSELEPVIDEENHKVSVTGFDFNANCVTTEQKEDGTYGKKLIIEFIVTPIEGFLGGNNIPTNGEGSGVYVDGEVIEEFDIPTHDVPIPDFTIEAKDKNVYLNATLTADQLTDDLMIQFGDEEAKLYSTWYNGLTDVQKKFVTVEIEKLDALTDLTADTTYTASVTIDPTTDGSVTEQTESDTAAINVFAPTLTFQDSTGDYAEDLTEYNYAQKNYVSSATVWKHGTIGSTDDGVTVIGDVPTLALTYTPALNTLTADTTVTVTVKIGDNNVTEYCVFDWQKCSDCPTTCTAKPDNAQFRIHLSSTSLTITKSGMEADENAIFTITGEGLSLTVTLKGDNGSLTITGLHPGAEYTVTEDGGWSWKYATAEEEQDITLENDPDENVLEFVNTPKDNITWLSGETNAQNVFKKAASAAEEK